MTAYYSLSDIAIIGGSWLPFGGQNPMEAMAVRKPVIIGPYTEHFLDVVSQAKQTGAIFQTDSLRAAIHKSIDLLDHSEAYQKAVDAGQGFLKMHQGALQKTLEMLAIPDIASNQ
jgi:3-deoxy-D-manno-octulosonic-acid transferase